MNIEEAEALHVELLQSLPGTGDATSALSGVVKLHRPAETIPTSDGRILLHCEQCFNDRYEDSWPCATIITINAYAHVSGLPATI